MWTQNGEGGWGDVCRTRNDLLNCIGWLSVDSRYCVWNVERKKKTYYYSNVLRGQVDEAAVTSNERCCCCCSQICTESTPMMKERPSIVCKWSKPWITIFNGSQTNRRRWGWGKKLWKWSRTDEKEETTSLIDHRTWRVSDFVWRYLSHLPKKLQYFNEMKKTCHVDNFRIMNLSRCFPFESTSSWLECRDSLNRDECLRIF